MQRNNTGNLYFALIILQSRNRLENKIKTGYRKIVGKPLKQS